MSMTGAHPYICRGCISSGNSTVADYLSYKVSLESTIYIERSALSPRHHLP